MGASSSRSQAYQQYYQSLSSTQDVNIDPHEVLGVSKNFEWDELTTAYRKIAKQVHPDKGQPYEVDVRTHMFRVVTDCFKKLAHEYKTRQEGRLHHDLKQESQVYHSQRQHSLPVESYTNNDSFLDKFNRAFEDNRLDDEDTSMGYGNMMTASTKTREDLNVPQLLSKFSRDTFNETFDRVTLADDKDMIVYKEPEALPLAKKVAYTELGGDRPDDFSSTQEGTHTRLDYTDYMKAHTQKRLVDPRAVQQRKEYKNIDAYEADRSRTISRPPTQEELEWRARKDRDAAKAEQARISRLQQRDATAAAHHERLNRLMLGGR